MLPRPMLYFALEHAAARYDGKCQSDPLGGPAATVVATVSGGTILRVRLFHQNSRDSKFCAFSTYKLLLVICFSPILILKRDGIKFHLLLLFDYD